MFFQCYTAENYLRYTGMKSRKKRLVPQQHDPIARTLQVGDSSDGVGINSTRELTNEWFQMLLHHTVGIFNLQMRHSARTLLVSIQTNYSHIGFVINTRNANNNKISVN